MDWFEKWIVLLLILIALFIVFFGCVMLLDFANIDISIIKSILLGE